MPKKNGEPTVDEIRAREANETRRALAEWEKRNDRAPGLTSRIGGGVRWEDRARMAAARKAAGLRLNDRDVEALARHPNPAGYVGAP